MKRLYNYFTITEKLLWSLSVLAMILSFLIFDRSNYLNLFSSLIGITSLIFAAKGNPIGQILIIIFSIFYGIISYAFGYYGEMLTYLGLTAPMAIIALISWLKHPYKGNKSEVEVNRLNAKEHFVMWPLTAAVTLIFYFLLSMLNTVNLIPSTISVATSFLAVYLTYRRSPYYAIAYAANDIVLIVLWSLAAIEDISYMSVIICFVAFLASDIYSFISWRKMQKRQTATS